MAWSATLDGQPLDDLMMVGANQEHGIVAHRSGRSEARCICRGDAAAHPAEPRLFDGGAVS
jgi:hypothetical protein